MGRFRRLQEADVEAGRIPPLADGGRFNAKVFSGKGPDGDPLRNDHQSAFFLPADEDGDGRIDHITVSAASGFGVDDPDELRALDSLRTLRFRESELSLRLVGLGKPADFARAPTLGPSTTWESATPFLVTRHLKLRGRKRDPREWSQSPEGHAAFVMQVLREELERRGLADAQIEAIDRIGPNRRPVDFRLFRDRRGDDGGRRPRGLFRIRFASPVTGPIALGHSCHFGLGLFLPRGSLDQAERGPTPTSRAPAS